MTTDERRDDIDIGLSKIQTDAFAGWKRPNEALRRVTDTDKKSFTSVTPTMQASKKVDLVQDITADCSVVASLCSAASRGEVGYVRVSHTSVAVERGYFMANTHTNTVTRCNYLSI